MIAFRGSIDIKRRPGAVFDLLANVHLVQQAEDSPVLALEITTPGPVGVGTRYREVVQMLPFYQGEILSEITAFEPPRLLEMVWTGAGMAGRDRYELADIPEGTRLVHQKWTSGRGLLRIMEPFMRWGLIPRLEARLEDIKRLLEEGGVSADAENTPLRR
jgi:hypothetical protein